MADHRISPPLTDKSVKLDGNDRGTKGHYSGEEYDSSTQDQPRFGEIGLAVMIGKLIPRTPRVKSKRTFLPKSADALSSTKKLAKFMEAAQALAVALRAKTTILV